MSFSSGALGDTLTRHAILKDYCLTALTMEVFGMMFVLIGSIFLALKAPTAVSFSVAVGLIVSFGIVLLLREHDVLRFNERSWTSSLFALSGISLPMSVFYFLGGCVREIRERFGRAKN